MIVSDLLKISDGMEIPHFLYIFFKLPDKFFEYLF